MILISLFFMIFSCLGCVLYAFKVEWEKKGMPFFSFLVWCIIFLSVSGCAVVIKGDTVRSEFQDGNLITTITLDVSVITPIKQMKIPKYNEHQVEVMYFY